MTTTAPSPNTVSEKVDALGPPGTPVTTPEVAAHFECTQRTIYNKLDALVTEGELETKKVGANSRVWWRPVGDETGQGETTGRRKRVRSHPVFDSEMVGVIVWGRDSTSDDATDLVIKDANDAFLEVAGFEYEEALDTSWRDLTPEEFYEVSEEHIEEVDATGSGVAYDKQYYHADGSRWWGLFESQKLDDDTYVEFVVDITDREQAKERLRESERRLRKAVSIDTVGVLFFDLSGNIHDANEAFERMSGYSREELLEMDWETLTPPEFRDATDRKAAELAARGETAPYEKQLVHKDGSRRWGLFAPERLSGAGETANCVEFIVDITERKEVERELRETTERLDVALNAAGMGTWAWDLDARTVRADERTMSLFDLPPTDEPVPVERLMERQSAAGVEQSENAMDASFEPGQEIQDEFHLEGVDPSRWISWRGRASEDDPSVLRGVSFDVTERKEAEQDLRETTERLDAFVQATSEVVYRMAPDWSEMYYLDGREFVPDTEQPREAWLAEYVPGDEQERVLDAVEAATEAKGTFELEHQVLRIDGSRGWVHSRAVPMLDDDGEITEWFGTATDITERKEIEEQLRENEAALERLNDVSRELIDADPETIRGRVAELTVDVLGVEYAALWRYDGRTGDLDRDAEHAAAGADLDAIRPSEVSGEEVWDTFVEDEIRVEDAIDTAGDSPSRLGSRVFVPLGRHGVILAGSVDPDLFDDRLLDLVSTVASTVETM